MTETKQAIPRRLENHLRQRSPSWAYDVGDESIRHRMFDIVADRRPWWDWGHRVMALTGSDFGGNWDTPTPKRIWYRLGAPKRMARTGYPRHRLSTMDVVTTYEELRRRTEGLSEDEMYEWQSIGWSQDDELHLGHQFWGGRFYGLRSADQALLLRWLVRWRIADWFGLRSWLYSQGLHAAVHRKKPGACNVTPAKGSGGYQHWHCERERRHAGPHRFGNYDWPGHGRVVYVPDGSNR